MKKSKINNYANSKKNSKNIFSTNNNNKNALGNNEKNNQKDSKKLGRNYHRVIQIFKSVIS
jgi:hypothetical protein